MALDVAATQAATATARMVTGLDGDERSAAPS